MSAITHLFSAILLLFLSSCDTSGGNPAANLPKARISVVDFQAAYRQNPIMRIDSAETLLGVQGKLFGGDALGEYYHYEDRDGISFYLIVSDSLVKGSMY